MKKVLLNVAIIAAMLGVMMSSCKKEESTQMKNGVAQTEQSMSPSEQRVLDFLADYKAVKGGAKADGEDVTPEVARWQIEKVFNYCYSFTEDQLSNMRQDKVSVTMPKVNVEGKISYYDLLETYGKVVDAVREAYKAINLEGKTLKFVTISIDEVEVKDNNSLTVVMNTGSSISNETTDDCFIWGTNGIFELPGRAPEQLQDSVNRYDAYYMLYYNPCPSCYTYLDTIYTYAIYYGNVNNGLFYASGLTYQETLDYQLCWGGDLDDEIDYIISLGHPGQPTNLYNIDWYYYTIIRSDSAQPEELGYYDVWHSAEVKYCRRLWRQYGNEYPISIETEE